MDASRLNPAGFYEFRLGHGTVRTRDGARMVVIPDTVLERMFLAQIERGDLAAIRAWGAELGLIAASAAGHRVDGLSPEAATEVIAGALALCGLGHASIERWGDLLAVRLDSAAAAGSAAAYSVLLAGLLESLFEADVACVPVGPETRFLLVHPSVADVVRAWIEQGAVVADVATRLCAAEESA